MPEPHPCYRRESTFPPERWQLLLARVTTGSLNQSQLDQLASLAARAKKGDFDRDVTTVEQLYTWRAAGGEANRTLSWNLVLDPSNFNTHLLAVKSSLHGWPIILYEPPFDPPPS
jgi:hypothetical protein